MLSKDDLVGLGMTPGPLFAQVFKAVKAAKTKDEAIAIAVAIRDGTFVRKERQTKVIDPESVLHWLLENRSWLPSGESRGEPPSISEINRMLSQGAITLNGRKPNPDDKMEFPIWELVFFKGSKTQCTLFFNLAEAPPTATWNTLIWEKRPNNKGGDDLWVVTGERWHVKGGMTKDGGLVEHKIGIVPHFPETMPFEDIAALLEKEEREWQERRAKEREKPPIGDIQTSAWVDFKWRAWCWWCRAGKPRVSSFRRKLRNLV
jgi:hypothetical protein